MSDRVCVVSWMLFLHEVEKARSRTKVVNGVLHIPFYEMGPVMLIPPDKMVVIEEGPWYNNYDRVSFSLYLEDRLNVIDQVATLAGALPK